MPVISPTKTDAAKQLNVTPEALNTKHRVEAEKTSQLSTITALNGTSQSTDTNSTVQKKAEQTTDSTEKKTPDQNTATAARKMVQTADQWRSCSKPHRI